MRKTIKTIIGFMILFSSYSLCMMFDLQGVDSLGTIAVSEENIPETSGVCGENLLWEYRAGNKQLIISGTGEMTDWTSIEEIDWFTKIPWYPFMEEINKVTIKDGVSNIGGGAFFQCAMTNIDITESVLSIGESAFYGCTSLNSIVLPAALKKIDAYAFQGCYSLQNVELPDNMTSIGKKAFYDSSISRIAIPENVSFIGKGAFQSVSLKQISVHRENKTYSSQKGVLFSKDKKTLIQYPCGNDVKIYRVPDTVENISAEGFAFCSNLESVYLSDQITVIKNETFRNCRSLKKIFMPDTLKHIEYGAFMECPSLSSVILPESITSVGDLVFGNCANLKEVVLPETLSQLGEGAFLNCTSLTKLPIPKAISVLPLGIFSGCSSLESVVIPSHIIHIDMFAFSDCSQLSEIIFQNPETTFTGYSFQNCDIQKLYGYPDSVAEDYAETYNLAFEEKLIDGDFNQDGDVNILDLIALNKIMIYPKNITDCQVSAADANNNKIIDAEDGILLMQTILDQNRSYIIE